MVAENLTLWEFALRPFSFCFPPAQKDFCMFALTRQEIRYKLVSL